jgi:hypothetical protein
MFRKSNEFRRIINMVDEDGNCFRTKDRGRMNITSHKAVLQALSFRSRRFSKSTIGDEQDGNRQVWSLDETGTIDTLGLNLYSENDAEQQEIRETLNIPVPDDVLQVHGYAPPKKADGIVRLIYENVNGISNKICNNKKLDRLREMHDELEVDVAAYSEHQLNMKDKKNSNGFNQLFKGGEAAVQSVVAHNVYENFGKIQQGGTCLIMFGTLTDQLDFSESRKDDTGLGRWSVMTVQGDGAWTQIVCSYNPCGNSKLNSGTTYQQHRRYFITQQKDLSCPRIRFREDLVKKLKQWREQGDKLIVCLDANEDIYMKSIGKALTDTEGLNMAEAVGEFTGKKISPTFFRGSKPIDGIWTTPDIIVTHTCVMPAGYGVGDHRLFVIDMQASSLIGEKPMKVQRFTSRRLNNKVSSGATRKYVARLETSIARHRIIERMGELHENCHSKKKFRQRMNRLDQESMELMTNAEKKCQKIKSGRIPFSPEAALWIRRTQVFRWLLRYHEGKISNRGNLKRTARQCGIENCLAIPIGEIHLRLRVCTNKCDYFRKNGKQYCRKHLHKCLQDAREAEDDQREKEILSIIQRERDKGFWRRLNFIIGKPRGGSVRRVLVEDENQEGVLTESATQETVQAAIFDNIHRKRFFLAEDAPICSGNLRGQFGYNADTKTARAILSGNYEYPPEFDQATREYAKSAHKLGV